MRIVIGADHAGFSLKVQLIELLKEEGYSILDVGTDGPDPVDYPDYAQAVGEAVLSGEAELGMLLCGSGVGASIAANKIRGIRAALCHDVYSAHQCREHDDANVLCLGPRVIGVKLAEELVRVGPGNIDLVHRHHNRNLSRLCVVHRLARLRPHTVARRHNQNHHTVPNLATPPHVSPALILCVFHSRAATCQ